MENILKDIIDYFTQFGISLQIDLFTPLSVMFSLSAGTAIFWFHRKQQIKNFHLSQSIQLIDPIIDQFTATIIDFIDYYDNCYSNESLDQSKNYINFEHKTLEEEEKIKLETKIEKFFVMNEKILNIEKIILINLNKFNTIVDKINDSLLNTIKTYLNEHLGFSFTTDKDFLLGKFRYINEKVLEYKEIIGFIEKNHFLYKLYVGYLKEEKEKEKEKHSEIKTIQHYSQSFTDRLIKKIGKNKNESLNNIDKLNYYINKLDEEFKNDFEDLWRNQLKDITEKIYSYHQKISYR